MGPQSFFKGLSWLLLLNLLIKPAWIFLIDRRVQNSVGHEVYGTYFALFNFTYILLFLADAGLTNLLTQRLAANGSLHVRQLFLIKLGLLGFYGTACTGLALLTGITRWDFLFYLIFIQALVSLFVFLRSLLTARQFFKTDAFFSVLDKFLLILFCIGPVYGFFGGITMPLFLQLQALSMLLATGTLLVFLWRMESWPRGKRLPLHNIATAVLPFVLVPLLMSAHNRLDAFLLERLHPEGATEAGIYAMAYRLLDAGNMIGYLTASFLFPFLARNQNKNKLVQNVVLLARHGLLLLSMTTFAFVAVFTPWLQNLLYHTTGDYNNKVILLTIAVLPAYYLIHVYGTVFTAVAAFRSFVVVLLLAVGVNLILNVLLIPTYGALGCTLAALVTQYACGFCLWIRASFQLKIRTAVRTALGYPVAAVIFGLLFYTGQQLTDNVWLILSSLVFLIGIVLLLVRKRLQKTISLFFK